MWAGGWCQRCQGVKVSKIGVKHTIFTKIVRKRVYYQLIIMHNYKYYIRMVTTVTRLQGYKTYPLQPSFFKNGENLYIARTLLYKK